MPKVQNSILRGIIHGAVKHGANFKQLCQKVGIDPVELNDAEKLIDWEISACAWDYAVEMTQDPNVSLALGQRGEYLSLWSVRLSDTKQFYSGRSFPLRAEFTFPKRNFQEYERMLQTKMVFNAERNCLIYRHEDIITPIVSYDKSLFSFFNLLLTEKQKTLATQKSFPDEIKELLLSQFGGQIPPIEVVAAHMKMSLRTFQRRLAGEKISFRQITNEFRKELALSLMNNPYSKKGDIAQVLGYTDLSSFQRAYKSWTRTS